MTPRRSRQGSPGPFDPLEALRVLSDHDVRFVLIGGFAGRIYGSPTVTNDLDLCYARDADNLEQLASALHELRAYLRGAPDGLPFVPDAKTLAAGLNFTFTTKAGNLDLVGMPSGTRAFDDLDRTAEELDLNGLRVRLASLDDLIRMKQAAGRPKDLIEAEVLGALREELDSSG